MKSLLLSLLTLLFAMPAIAQSDAGFASFLAGVQADAQAAGIGARGLSALRGATFEASIIRLDQKQPEGQITFDKYLKSTITSARVERGQRLLDENAAELNRVSRQYGVPTKIIVALWGKETDFGRNTGGESVISALATLAYEGRRADFFRNELIEALRIIDAGHIDAADMQGSWAGAMGQCQFMPTSFFKYAVDGDGDGRIDIWNDTTDVFASAANYLHTEGWNAYQGWGLEVSVPINLDQSYVGKDKTLTYAEWRQRGVTSLNGEALPQKDTRVSLIQPDGANGRSFLITDNFRILLHWNKSSYFAASVGLLADAIGD